MRYLPWPYQDFAREHIKKHKGAGLFMDMGLGKTVVTLTAIDELLKENKAKKILVIAPKKIAQNVWKSEAAKWDHTKHLTISEVLGSEVERKKALLTKANIYVINRENVAWLVAHYATAFPFDMLVIDESSSFKNPKSKRFKALRIIRPIINRVVILTGTPVPNGLLDLWSQVYLLDQGYRLSSKYHEYRDKYFKPGANNGHVVYEHNLVKFKDPRKKPGHYNPEDLYRKNLHDVLGEDILEREIHDKIKDICISMKTEDYLVLPKRIDRVVSLRLNSETQKKYSQFEEQQVLALSEEKEITAINAAALTNKLLQFSNGAVYDENRAVHHMHDEKLDALEEIIETANGQPVLVAYAYQHDLWRLRKRLAKYKPRELVKKQDEDDWNDGKIQVLLVHPASAGHGLNLQAGGNIIVWFGLTWALELFQQLNKRLHRQGQTKPVIIHYLVIKGSMDEDVLEALEGKADKQEAMLRAVKARVVKIKIQKLAA